ncbi:MAG: D-alanine aminotransferase [Prosthecobacter sp.]|nr:D-alanine aminotransferase [Prosthecobacter sp.]
MSSIVWLNGSLLPAAEARISPFDQGFLVGDGVFETLMARQSLPVAAGEHWRRLLNSCAKAGLEAPSENLFQAALQAVITANNLHDARLRVTLTRGESPPGSQSSLANQTFLATAVPLKPWPPVERVCLAPWTRNEKGALSGIKSLSYAENLMALAHARSLGCGEALLADTRGELCEGTGSNVFLVVAGRLITPPLSSGCLAGVTRALVLEACRREGLAVSEKPVPLDCLQDCEELFLTSSTREVHPVSQVDERLLTAPGPVTRQVMQAYASLLLSSSGT